MLPRFKCVATYGYFEWSTAGRRIRSFQILIEQSIPIEIRILEPRMVHNIIGPSTLISC